MASKPSIPKGTRDFSPIEVSKRNYIIGIMRSHFENFGYQPIETPSFENSETLMGKYGEEGDRLIFKILNSGDYISEFNNILINSIELCTNFHRRNQELMGNTMNIVNVEYGENRRDELSNYLKKENPIFFKNENVSSSDISNDVLSLVIEKCADEDFNLFKKSDSELYYFRDSIFANFYIRLKNKYLTGYLSEKALRYDLTVPFARYVVQHQNEIEFPFKRYQIQPVWRADRPQKGRFREFYQCDADVVGSTSLWQEVELVQLYDAVFTSLGLEGVTIKINNRKILSGIAEVIGASDKLIDFTVALDKLDKIGEEGVKKEMVEKGISEVALKKVQSLFNFTGSIDEKLEKLEVLLSESEEGKKGIEELKFICENVTKLGLQNAILDLDVTLARGLNYYTGAIFEVAAPKTVAMGSIGGGGRYDDLTGIFDSKNKMSGVGISFGLDRIYLVLEELNLFPETVVTSVKVLFLNYGEKEAFEAMQAISKLRNLDIKVDLYPDNAKIDKQFKYAERRAIPYVVKEVVEGIFTLKNIVSGDQKMVSFEELVSELK